MSKLLAMAARGDGPSSNTAKDGSIKLSK